MMLMRGLLTIILMLSSCTSLSVLQEKLYPLRKGEIEITNNAIYDNGVVFAELFYFGTSGGGHRGLAIYYYPYSKVVWIYPRESSLLSQRSMEYNSLQAIKRLMIEYQNNSLGFLKFFWGNFGDEEVKFARCFDVRISDDGKFITYKTPGIFKSSHKYLVEYGISK